MYDVVALGELLIDFVHKETTKAGYPVMQANPGGAPGNFLSTASLFGARAAFIGKVGDDGFGLMLKRTLKESGIDVRGVLSDPNVFTTLAFVTLDENGDRAFSFARKPGADTMLTASELPMDIIENTRFFHFGSLSTNRPVPPHKRQWPVQKQRERLLPLIPIFASLCGAIWSLPRSRCCGDCGMRTL